MILKVNNKKLNVQCPKKACVEKSSHNSKTTNVADQTLRNSLRPNIAQTVHHDISLKTKSFVERRIEKLGDNHHKNTVLFKTHPEEQEEELLRINTSVFTTSNHKPSFLPNPLQDGNLARLSHHSRCCFPLTFLRQKTSSFSFYTLLTLQLLIIIVTNQCVVPCNGQQLQEESNDNPLYVHDIDQDIFPTQDLRKLYQLYQDTSTTSDDFTRDFREFSDETEQPEEEVHLVVTSF
jgi:hypothetical protein